MIISDLGRKRKESLNTCSLSSMLSWRGGGEGRGGGKGSRKNVRKKGDRTGRGSGITLLFLSLFLSLRLRRLRLCKQIFYRNEPLSAANARTLGFGTQTTVFSLNCKSVGNRYWNVLEDNGRTWQLCLINGSPRILILNFNFILKTPSPINAVNVGSV